LLHRRAHQPSHGAEPERDLRQRGNHRAEAAPGRILHKGRRIDHAADHPDQTAGRRGHVGQQGRTEPHRRQKEHHVLYGVHLHPVGALELLAAGHGRRLDAVLHPRLADPEGQYLKQQQGEQRGGNCVKVAHAVPRCAGRASFARRASLACGPPLPKQPPAVKPDAVISMSGRQRCHETNAKRCSSTLHLLVEHHHLQHGMRGYPT
jgi:hypothetical protein